MKNLFLLLITVTKVFATFGQAAVVYDNHLVEITTSVYNRDKFFMIKMSREGEHIKAKYFAFKNDEKNVYQRFKEWSVGKRIISLTNIGYMNGTSYDDAVPVGLRIDNGNVVNQNLLTPGLDGLVIVYATGGIACGDISDGNLFIKCGDQGKILDVRKPLELWDFIRSAESQKASVLQDHLLVYKDKLRIYNNSSAVTRQRRFLAVGKDIRGQIMHVIIHSYANSTLLDGTKLAYTFLKDYKGIKEVLFMLNLDTGFQDVFRIYDSEGNEREDIKGAVPLEVSDNLLVYYYE